MTSRDNSTLLGSSSISTLAFYLCLVCLSPSLPIRSVCLWCIVTVTHTREREKKESGGIFQLYKKTKKKRGSQSLCNVAR